jgi:SPP1 family predicted phage head-tail adaptor
MPALSSEELAYMREVIEDELLPDTCDILSVSKSPDGQGGVIETWGTASADVGCRLDMKQGRELVSGGALQPYTQYVLSLPYNTSVNTANRIKLDGTTYAITSVNTSQSWIAVRRVMLEKL